MKKFYVILLALVALACCFTILYVFFSSGENIARTLIVLLPLGPAAILCGAAIGHITGPDAGKKPTQATKRLRNT